MKKFQFRLDTLLRVCEERENIARHALSVARRALQEKVEQMENLESEQKAVEESLRFGKKVKIDAAKLVSSLGYMEILRERIVSQQDEVIESKNVVESKRQEAMHAMQKRKLIEKLREKQYVRWKGKVEDTEKSFFDEQATMRYFRGKR